MTIAKVTEITAESTKSFEDAVQRGIERVCQTVDNVKGAWVKEQKLVIENKQVTKYRVDLKVTFVLND